MKIGGKNKMKIIQDNRNGSAEILFNENEGRKFLLLNYPSKHWDFVKGKMEKDETPHETAKREAREETGITDIQFVDDFEESVKYEFRFNKVLIQKKVVFFLAKTNSENVKSLGYSSRNP